MDGDRTTSSLQKDTPAAFAREVTPRFQDADPAGLVFFARFFDLFHDTYVEFLEAKGLSVASTFASAEFAAPLAHAEADYRRPIRFGERVSIEIAAAAVGRTSLAITYRVRAGSGEIAATGKTVHVFVDRSTFRKIEIPSAIRRAFESIDAEQPASFRGPTDSIE